MKYRLILTFFIIGTLHLSAQNINRTFQNLDVFQLEWANDPQISPDGNQVVYVRSGYDIMKDRRQGQLWIINSDGSSHQKVTPRDVSESSPRWSPDGTRIAFTSSSDAGSEVFVYWIAAGKLARLTQLERSPGGISWSPDGTKIAFSMLVPETPPYLVKAPKAPKGANWADKPRVTTRLKYEQDGSGYIEPGFHHYFVIPSEGGTPRQITTGDFFHRGTPQWSKDGKSLVFSSNRNENWEYEFRNSEIYTVSVNDGQIKQLTDRKGPDSSPKVSPDGKKIAYLGFDDKVQTYQVTRLYIMNLDGGSKKEINTKLDRSISGITWDSNNGGIYFQYDDEGVTKIGYTNLSGKYSVVTTDVGGTSIGRPYGGGSYTVNAQGKIAYTHSQPDRPADLMIMQKGQIAKKLTGLNEDLLAYRNLGKIEEIWYKSTVDDRDIQGWIAFPPDFDSSKKYPLLVENHGGPVSNYGPRFSPEIQLYAADGYVVFYPNPRGSTSYGEEFGNLLYNNYPGDDYQDVMDGVDAMIAKGYIQDDGLYVTGGSAGGIMSAWIIGKNNRFKAAAVVKPVMNWVSKTLTADNYYGYSFYRYPDWPWENIEGYMKFSPISLVGNIQTPTLVMVGTSDMRTPLSESKQLYSALKLRKIETALVEIPGSYHFISARPSQMITKIDHVLAWFRKYRNQ
jgi:dipeptidyl aminopeptidase/acylaminoacyl peptidase